MLSQRKKAAFVYLKQKKLKKNTKSESIQGRDKPLAWGNRVHDFFKQHII